MRKVQRIFGGIIAVVGLVCASRVGYATTFVSSGGSACQPQTTDPINHTGSGAVNPSSSSGAIYMCELPAGTQTANPIFHSAMVVRYKDLTSADNFWCFVHQTFYDGSMADSGTKYTCSTAGGCTDPTTAYIGGGYLQWSSTELGSNLYNQFVDANYGVICGVPKTGGSGSSFIISYYGWN
jgi:hypothetical protein